MVRIDVSHHAPYQGGYIDFSPVNGIDISKYTGPPRTSLFDDLVYYHTQPNLAAQSSLHTFDTAVFFPQNIIAGIWMNSIAYVGSSVSTLEYAVEQSRKHSPSIIINNKITSYGGLEWLGKNLFHIYSWKRRCSQLLDWTDWNILELKIFYSQLKTPSGTSNVGQQDWLFMKTRLTLCETCSRDIVASALGLLSLIESHKSVEEAESARILALLGTIYLPLSLTVGILSMGGTFTPGQGQFWIFFVVAVPLLIMSVAFTYLPILMRKLMDFAIENSGKKATRGVKRAATFMKETSETV